MRWKKTNSFLLSILLALSLCLSSLEMVTYASSTEGIDSTAFAAEQNRYFYNQLSEESKKFYQAMYDMYTKGIFKTGTEEYDLVKNGYLTQEQLKSYANGDTKLASSAYDARDAFYLDYPEIFYVDFSKISFRVTQTSTGTYGAYLLPDKSGKYYKKGFTSESSVEKALAEYETRANEIVEGAKNLTIEEGDNLIKQQVKYVHDEIINHTSYRLENDCSKGNTGHIKTPYGALVKGESLCEGYARAVKSLLDRLNIPCILVVGTFQSRSDRAEPHMWNYVQVDGIWYGLDATADDPISPYPGENGLDGFEKSEFLFAGADTMSRRHVITGVMSENGQEFLYPDLTGQNEFFDEIANKNGLKVEYGEKEIEGDIPAGIFKISYYGMGAAKAMENGYYLLMKETQYYEKTDEWKYGTWAYCIPDYYNLNDSPTELTIQIAASQYVEFAVTTEAPGDYLSNPKYLTFTGDPLSFEAHTDVIYNPKGTYVAPPFIKESTPTANARIDCGEKYHIKTVYDDRLELAEGATEAGYSLYVPKNRSLTAAQYCKIENFKWDGNATIEFDFTPSNMWIDDFAIYNFNITGLVGVKSGKVPKPIVYSACFPRKSACPKLRGHYLDVFAKPSLLENTDLFTKNWESWETEDGEPITADMIEGITLVATSPTHAQTDTMNELIGTEFPKENVLKSETYNINFATCRKDFVKLGDAVRVSVGFPEGYGPEDEGVTFKAYHFIKNKLGEITGVEEIPCTITKYGLVITCESFSPFAIVAVEDDGSNVSTSKSVILLNSQGGKITGADNIFTLENGKSKKLTIQAEEGYVIDSVVVGGKYQKITNSKSMTVTANYKDLTDGDFIEAQFIAETIREKEEKRGEKGVLPTPVAAKIALNSEKLTVKVKEKLQIAPKITKYHGLHTYQWYKNGVAIPGEVHENLVINSVTKQDAGAYTLVVTTAVGAANVKSTSKICNVTIQEETKPIKPNPEPVKPDPEPVKPNPQPTKPKLANISGLKATSVTTDKLTLKWKAVKNADGYEVLRYNSSKRKFVKIATASRNSYTDKKRSSGQAYRYKIKAFKKVNGKPYYGKESKEIKIIVKPKAPTKVSAKRLSKTSIQMYFKPVKGATTYRIHQYDKKKEEYKLVYRVEAKKLYQYNNKTKKWKYVRKVKTTKDGRLIVKITGLKKSDKNLKYYIKTSVVKKGYTTRYSEKSKTITVK